MIWTQESQSFVWFDHPGESSPEKNCCWWHWLTFRQSESIKQSIKSQSNNQSVIDFWAELLEAWLAVTSVKYHDNPLILMLFNHWLALIMLRTTGPWLPGDWLIINATWNVVGYIKCGCDVIVFTLICQDIYAWVRVFRWIGWEPWGIQGVFSPDSRVSQLIIIHCDEPNVMNIFICYWKFSSSSGFLRSLKKS